jgi:choline dehydrogenase
VFDHQSSASTGLLYFGLGRLGFGMNHFMRQRVDRTVSTFETSQRVYLDRRLQPSYDFVVCGAGSSGSVIARRLAESPDVTVLLLEAGGSGDDVDSVMDPNLWPTNLGTERDWGFLSEPNAALNGRALPLSMGKTLGGGSGINGMVWARGHRDDWDFFASEARDADWSHDAVLEVYRRIENWRGTPDPKYRSVGGPVFVQPAPDPSPAAQAFVTASRVLGVETYDNPNGAMMEERGGAAITDVRLCSGKRQSVFRSYPFRYLAQSNLTVLTNALVRRVTFEGGRATGVEISYRGAVIPVVAGAEVILSMGAIHTPKVLMQSGIGGEGQLRRFGIPLVQHLPGVGQDFQDHVGFSCIWESPDSERRPHAWVSEAAAYWAGSPESCAPDLFGGYVAVPLATAETSARHDVPEFGWTFFAGLARPRSRGRVELTGAGPHDPIRIDTDFLSHPDDLKAAVACVQGMREVGNSPLLKPFVKREVMPGYLTGADLEAYLRDAAMAFWHQVGTARMGRDPMAVVDGRLKVYGVDGLRVADGSIMPRITTGNTMAPCVIIGERAARAIADEHGL